MKKTVLLFLLLCLLFSIFVLPASSYGSKSELVIIFTHDLHSHLDPFTLDGESVGGFARINSIIKSTRSQYNNVLVLDGGDFSMGTLYQTLYENIGAEYKMLGELGYDAVTFGNHEFDYGFDSVDKMINAAKNSSTSLPPILCANIDAKASGITEQELNELNIYEYIVLKRGDFQIAIFGLLGSDAAQLSSASNLIFENYIDAAMDTVSEIKNLYSPDAIICLSHTGTGKTVDDEDIKLAESIEDIDLIISGHSHSILDTPIIVNDTVIASCGEYGENVGKLIFKIENGILSLDSYELCRIDNSIPIDTEIEQKVDELRELIGTYLNKFGYNSSDDILAYSPFDFPEQSSMDDVLSEQQLGNLISDSYIHAVKKAEGDEYIPVDVAVAPLGVIRASIDRGNITVAQAFEISSLGIGNDGVAGYPLCSVYLYGYELWNLAEVDASVSGIMSYAQLYCSGLHYSANTNRMFMNRVYDCWLVNENGERVEIEDDKLYRVVSGISSAMMLGMVKDKTFGLLELTPKDKNGNSITDFNEHIAIDNNGSEVKEWKALADYLASFEKNEDGVPTVPLRYAAQEGRKNINSAFTLSEIFRNWNKFSWVLFCFIIVILLSMVLIVFSFIKKLRKRRKCLLVKSDLD